MSALRQFTLVMFAAIGQCPFGAASTGVMSRRSTTYAPAMRDADRELVQLGYLR